MTKVDKWKKELKIPSNVPGASRGHVRAEQIVENTDRKEVQHVQRHEEPCEKKEDEHGHAQGTFFGHRVSLGNSWRKTRILSRRSYG